MRILFFAPHTAIWVHAFPEALVAESLQQAGHQVVYVTCGEVLQEQCVAMSAFRVGFKNSLKERQRVCDRCNASKKVIKDNLKLIGYDLADVLLPDDYHQIEEIMNRLDAEN